MSTPTIHTVQTFVRVVFSDGVVAGLMTTGTEVNPVSSLPAREQARQIISKQGELIKDQFGSMKPELLYAAAVATVTQQPVEHQAPRAKLIESPDSVVG